MNKLYRASVEVVAYFWAESKEDAEFDAHTWLAEEMNNIMEADSITEAQIPVDANCANSIPWGEAPDGYEDETVMDIVREK